MLTCLIVEDEPLAAELLQDYIKQVPHLQLKGICTDALLALEALQQQPIDLIFLDIHLPGLKGLDFLRTLKSPPAVILTTAYHEYALQGYELNVVDYLLKPIEFMRFVEAVNKVKIGIPTPRQQEFLSIQSDKKTIIIPIDDIVYVESQREYVKIQTLHQAYVTKYSLTKMEEELNPALFLRVHRSFIIALSKIKSYSAHEMDVAGKMIPIGGNYREQVAQKLQLLFK